MRIKLLRSLGQNLPVPLPDEGNDVAAALEKDPPFIEGQVREMGDTAAHYLIRHLLAEETADDATKLPVKLGPRRPTSVAQPPPTPAPFAPTPSTERKKHDA